MIGLVYGKTRSKPASSHASPWATDDLLGHLSGLDYASADQRGLSSNSWWTTAAREGFTALGWEQWKRMKESRFGKQASYTVTARDSRGKATPDGDDE